MAKYWKRIFIAGIAVELLYAVYVYYLATADLVGYKPEGLAVAFVLFGIGGFWAARPAQDSRLAIGLAVGLVGMLFYYAISMPTVLAGEMEFPLMAWVNHGLKLAGGAVGAFLAGRIGRGAA
ncbi:hypothetical protein OZN62_08230 [Aurantiacibacter sp. MUD11]|uniref:hypothetical protein n=1 Tax=Aurantiacibacter sp. MUD11 TaxID=3003265 RepID=UPI0022AAC118|nr:hypothetical protein [Aurantiacibacter sp. MUD11]WAT16927.1 hypothetical protein OZN62_08230 [Aurantiacibacter sp. MUD11]